MSGTSDAGPLWGYVPGGRVLDAGGNGGAGGPLPVAAVLGVRADSLPMTGLSLAALMVMGLSLLLVGLEIRRRSGALG